MVEIGLRFCASLNKLLVECSYRALFNKSLHKFINTASLCTVRYDISELMLDKVLFFYHQRLKPSSEDTAYINLGTLLGLPVHLTLL